MSPAGRWTAYFLLNETGRKSYRGATVNLTRRLRQHRGEIRGGAKYTSQFQTCEPLMYIEGFPTASLALSFEWHTKRTHLHCHHDMLRHSQFVAIHPKVATFFAPLRLPRFQVIKRDLTIRLAPTLYLPHVIQELQAHYLIQVQPRLIL